MPKRLKLSILEKETRCRMRRLRILQNMAADTAKLIDLGNNEPKFTGFVVQIRTYISKAVEESLEDD